MTVREAFGATRLAFFPKPPPIVMAAILSDFALRGAASSVTRPISELIFSRN
jgi:hypothetical protein